MVEVSWHIYGDELFKKFFLFSFKDIDPNVLFQAFFGGDGGSPFHFQSGGGGGGGRGSGFPGGFQYSYGK
jgi:hypothetical protein